MLEERSSLGLWISIRGGRRFGSRSSNGGFEAVRKAEKKVSSFSVLLKKFLDWGKKELSSLYPLTSVSVFSEPK
jgi:hypothetical protein